MIFLHPTERSGVGIPHFLISLMRFISEQLLSIRHFSLCDNTNLHIESLPAGSPKMLSLH